MTLKELLSERGIVCAHIVDDAFDEGPAAPMSAEQVQGILDRIDEDGLNAICAMLALPEGDEEQVRVALQDVEKVKQLFAGRDNLPGNAATTLFADYEKEREGKRAQLEPLLTLLEANGVKCITFGADYNPQGSDEPQLFFIDLRLREGSTISNHEDAVKAFSALSAVHRDGKPFVFLMSSQPRALGLNREEFRRLADLFQSEFEDVEKSLFADQRELTRVLTRYTQAMPELAKLRNSMDNVRTAVDRATENVLKELRALDLADYFVLFKNTTAVEKVGLGNYVVDMLLDYLAHEIEGADTVWDLAKDLTELKFETLPRIRFGWTRAALLTRQSNTHRV